MNHVYLMNISTAVFFVCYIPELYANYRNKNANVYNMPEKVLMVMGSGFALSYALMNSDVALISNYGPILFLDVVALLMRAYYVYINRNRDIILREADSPTNEQV
jgi:lipid-A-disaccharide synthase-like uncharacterized protein